MRSFLLPSLIFLFTCTAQISLSQDLKKDADNAFANKEWQKAASLYGELLIQQKADSAILYNVGYCHLQQADYKKALSYFKQAEEQNMPAPFVLIAKAQALMGLSQNDKALEVIIAGIKHGAAPYMRLKKDSTFDVFRGKEKFEKALEQAKLNAYPCLQDSSRRHFDFWVGDWDVYVKGSKVGENSITMANGGCAIHEDYTTGWRNYTGQSINYYDPQDQKWHQLWVGSAGGVLDYVEIDKAEGMLKFQCDFMTPKGTISYSRLTFTANDDGTVRQFFENSQDGENWTPGFDGLYKPKK